MSKEASSVEDTEARSAMKLALEALISYGKSPYIKQSHPKRWANGNEAIKALEEALAKQEQRSDSEQLGEPVAKVGHLPETLTDRLGLPLSTPLYTTPQQPSTIVRTWVGLTTKDQKEIERQSVYVEGAIRMTEAKLKEKNSA